MPAIDPIQCQNCGVAILRLEEAKVWLDRPVCGACYQKLAGRGAIARAGFWMPVTMGLLAVCVGLAVLLILQRKPKAAVSDVVDAQPLPQSPGPTAGPARDELLQMVRADRTWYWHFERHNKNEPIKFVVDSTNHIKTTDHGGKPYTLELRWVFMHDGHCLLPFDSESMEGFNIRTGRQAGIFTEEKLPVAQQASAKN